MTELLEEMERALADLLQSGLATGGPAAVSRLEKLGVRCKDVGLPTGAELLEELAAALSARAHAMEKDNLPAAAAFFRTVRYVELCREKLQETEIRRRWQELGNQDEQKQEENHA